MRQVQAPDQSYQQLQDAAAAATRELEAAQGTPYGIPTAIKRAAYSAHLGELVRCDPTPAAFTVTLPQVAQADIGRVITIYNVSASANVITIQCPTGTLIDGASTTNLAAGWSRAILVVLSSTTWGII